MADKTGDGTVTNIVPGFTSVNDFAQKALGKLKLATRAANELPAAGDDYDFYSSFEGFRQFCNSQGDKLLGNIQRLAGQQGADESQVGLSKILDLEDRIDSLIETNDTLLENAGALLDEAEGISKPTQSFSPGVSKPQLIVTSWNKKRSEALNEKSRNFRLMHARNIARPQLKFKDRVDNSNVPFVPVITHKPNALKPLPEVFDTVKKSFLTKTDSSSPAKRDSETQTEAYPHPYQHELDHLEPLPSQLEPVDNPSYTPLEATPFTLVDTVSKLEELSRSLKQSKEIAVDLEHHSYRSYLGFTCLMQISTAEHDYVVDTLELRSELQMLNDAFTDPKIVKVFHGANMDIDWLQRDLGLYVVNMFDTHQASRSLGFPHHSLASLLSRYCQVEADKQYQLADWRIRPLPEEMLHYAREDTHYLLYIYHTMKNELIKRGNDRRNLLRAVLDQSTRICVQRYNKPIFTNDSHVTAFQKNRKIFNKKQMHAFKKLFAWRDSLARQEDESTGYILPMHMLFQIAEILPKDQGGILACCNPVPPLVKQNINEIYHFILEARGYQANKEGKVKKGEVFASKTNTFSAPLIDPLESLLYCPHDNNVHQEGQRSTNDLSGPSIEMTSSSLFGGSTATLAKVSAAAPIITIFDTPSSGAAEQLDAKRSAAQKKIERLTALFANPFEMYLPSTKVRQIAQRVLDADKITMDTKTTPSKEISTFQPLSVWIMKKATPKPAAEKEPPTEPGRNQDPGTYETPIVFNPDAAKKRKQEEEEEAEDEAVPVRQMGNTSAKKRKHSANPSGETPRPKKDRRGEHAERRSMGDTGAADRGHHHGNQYVREAEERVIEPYDYSRADYGMFQDSQRSRGRGRGRGHRGHDRGGRGRGRGHSKGHPRPKVHQDGGRRSMTYTNHRGNQGGGSRGQRGQGSRNQRR
ncbi:exosome component 10 [Strongylocentrotus purpuratus]|uniref:Exosome complex component 10 n=1 Tax=Strongylocentrotus purpuratus TaxID=7668 RepID=A0A7M7NEJ2_STRPU|nr:exosome component 10 [Strongylocentrotus purpuratus]